MLILMEAVDALAPRQRKLVFFVDSMSVSNWLSLIPPQSMSTSYGKTVVEGNSVSNRNRKPYRYKSINYAYQLAQMAGPRINSHSFRSQHQMLYKCTVSPRIASPCKACDAEVFVQPSDGSVKLKVQPWIYKETHMRTPRSLPHVYSLDRHK